MSSVQHQPLPPLLTTADVAAMLRCDPSAVRHALRRDPDFPRPLKLPACRGHRWRQEDLLAWLESKARAAAGRRPRGRPPKSRNSKTDSPAN